MFLHHDVWLGKAVGGYRYPRAGTYERQHEGVLLTLETPEEPEMLVTTIW
jgi:hypothetical protein